MRKRVRARVRVRVRVRVRDTETVRVSSLSRVSDDGVTAGVLGEG